MATLSMFHPQGADAGPRPLASHSTSSRAGAPPSHLPPLAASPSEPSRSAGARPAPRAAAPNPFVEVAARLLSETAHDLRSPLTSIRELIRLVHDGDLGDTTAAQREMLFDAIEQCNVIGSLVDNMLQLDRLRSGLPRTRRLWIAPAEIVRSVSGSVGERAARRRVHIHWDGFVGGVGPIFADPGLLCRLIVNLLDNAIAVSDEGRSVMVRLEPPQAEGLCRLSVVDRGPGMSPEQIERMARRGESGTGGSGLGLAISRTLAALHFSQLAVESQRGRGMRISAELPAAGPASVAAAFVRWREAANPKAARNQATLQSGALASPPASGCWLPFDGPSPRFADAAMVVAVRLDAKASDALVDATDDALHADQRLHELVYRTDARRWVLMWDNSREESRRRIASLDRQLRASFDAVELEWSEPADQPVVGQGQRARVCEQLIRDMLRPNGRRIVGHDRSGRTLDPAEDTAGTALRRLKEELQRLSDPLARQSRALQSQADTICHIVRPAAAPR